MMNIATKIQELKSILLDLGFAHHPEWDYKEINVPNYRAEIEGNVWRAFIMDSNGLPYVILGRVTTPEGRVDRWRDCVSEGSIERKIKTEALIAL